VGRLPPAHVIRRKAAASVAAMVRRTRARHLSAMLKAVIALVATLFLLAAVGCESDNPNHVSFWDQKPDPRALKHGKSPYEGN